MRPQDQTIIDLLLRVLALPVALIQVPGAWEFGVRSHGTLLRKARTVRALPAVCAAGHPMRPDPVYLTRSVSRARAVHRLVTPAKAATRRGVRATFRGVRGTPALTHGRTPSSRREQLSIRCLHMDRSPVASLRAKGRSRLVEAMPRSITT
jgi:hypothetical protein